MSHQNPLPPIKQNLRKGRFLQMPAYSTSPADSDRPKTTRSSRSTRKNIKPVVYTSTQPLVQPPLHTSTQPPLHASTQPPLRTSTQPLVHTSAQPRDDMFAYLLKAIAVKEETPPIDLSTIPLPDDEFFKALFSGAELPPLPPLLPARK